MPSIHDQLDRLAAVFIHQGMDPATIFAPGPSRAEVQTTLTGLRLDPPPEVVDFFTWRTVVSPLGFAGIFWETDYHSFGEMVTTYRSNLEVGERFGALTETMWPGTRSHFPILMCDPSEIVSVDCGAGDGRGSMWFSFTQAEAFMMFASIPEALGAALYAAEAGYWTWSVDDQRVDAPRDWMPWPADRESPPWKDPRDNGA